MPPSADTLRFPPGFRWGVSTSAYQVEGGETPSQWQAWEAAGRIKNGDVRGAACDWWANAERDFDLARDLGVNALRLSLDWARLENGVPDAGDRVRPWVVARAAAALHDVLRRGFDVRGYYHWTLVDNFEWAEGWSLRFGLVALDPATGARAPRGSAHLYGAIARGNALTRADVARWAPDALAEVFP